MENSIEIEDKIVKKTQAISYITFDILSRYLLNETYKPIIQFLWEDNKTLEEIHAYYSKFNPKSEITLYRYIKELIKVKLVVQAGRRVDYSNSFTKNLYCATSYFFIPKDWDLPVWQGKLSLKLSGIINKILRNKYGSKANKNDEIIAFFSFFYKQKKNLIENIFLQYSTDINRSQELIIKLNELNTFIPIGYYYFFDDLGFFIAILENDDWLIKLSNIFSKNDKNKSSETKTKRISLKKKYGDSNIVSIRQEPDVVKFTDYGIWLQYFGNPKYELIFEILKHEPMSIQEIYFQYIKKFEEKPNNTNSFANIKENTLYKYIQELKASDYIIEVGRRLHLDKNYSEILYGRSAYIFYMDFNITDENWNFFTNQLVDFIEFKFQTKLDRVRFLEVYLNFFQESNQVSIKSLEEYATNDIISEILDLNESFSFISSFINMEYLIEHGSKFKEDILSCFIK